MPNKLNGHDMFRFWKFSNDIAGERKRRNMSQQDVANILVCSKATISRMENGKLCPPTGDFLLLCDLFSLSPMDYLWYPEDDYDDKRSGDDLPRLPDDEQIAITEQIAAKRKSRPTAVRDDGIILVGGIPYNEYFGEDAEDTEAHFYTNSPSDYSDKPYKAGLCTDYPLYCHFKPWIDHFFTFYSGGSFFPVFDLLALTGLQFRTAGGNDICFIYIDGVVDWQATVADNIFSPLVFDSLKY